MSNVTFAQIVPSDTPCNAPVIGAGLQAGSCNQTDVTMCCGGADYGNFLAKKPTCGFSPTNKDAWIRISNMVAGQQYNFIYTEKAKFRATWVEIYELPDGADCSEKTAYKPLACTRVNDVIVFENATASATFTPPNSNSQYFVRFMRYNTAQDGSIEGKICVTRAYVNDEPCGAILLPIQPTKGTNPILGQNYFAADWEPLIHDGRTCGPNNDVWYKFVPDECSVNIFLKNLTPNSYEIQAAIMESVDGTCTNLKEVTPCGGAKDKYADINLTADGLTIGKTYYIIVDGFSPPYFNATGQHSIEAYKKPNAPKCPDIETPCDCSKPGCTNPIPLKNSTLGNIELDKAKNDGSTSGCFDLTPEKIPVLKGTNRVEFCASYTAQIGDELMAFDNVVHKDVACSLLTNLSKNVVYEAGDCNAPIPPVCKDANGVSPVYRLQVGKSYKFCRQVVADASDPDCVGKNYQAFCAFLWKIQSREIINKTICNNTFYTFNGQNYNKSGTYTAKLISPFTGCDSTAILNLTVLPKLTSVITPAPVCAEKGYIVGNTTYVKTGIYTIVLKNAFNCDSTVTLNLTVLDTKKSTISRTICAEESVTIGDQTYNQSGTFTKVVKAVGGCDSTVTLQLNVLKRNENILNQTLCFGQKYTYKGKEYAQTGTYDLEKFKAANGCDSVMVLKLLILPDYSNMKEEKTICSNQTVVFGDKTLNTAGVYTYLYKSKYLNLACDSFVTLTLKIDKRKETKQKKVVCPGEKIIVGNQTFDKTGIFEVSYAIGANCDSVLILDLTVRPIALQINRKDTICEKTSVTIAGQTFDKEGIYTFTKKYAEGCDSAKITAEIVVIRPNPKPENVFVCKGDSAVYKGVKYAVGTYNRDTIRNVLGCIITWTTLNVSKKTISATVTTTSELCEGKCDGTAKVDAVINAAIPVTYIWNNGNTTDALEKLCKGAYTVTVTDKDGCTNVQTATINSQDPAFTANTTTKATACDAAKTGEISLTVLPTNGTYTYTWSNGEKSKDIIKLPKGNYSVTIEDKDGCKRVLKDINVSVSNTPPFSISIPSQTDTLIVGQNKDVTISVTPPVFVTYQWTPQDGVTQKDLSNIFNIKATKAGDITYTWTAKDVNGCEAKANITLYVRNIQIPSIFTPSVENIDGFVQPFPNPADNRYELQNFQIFTRWGTLVYDSKADKGWWNGKMHNTGEDLAADVYVYVFTYQINGVNTPVSIKGDITLIR